MSREEDLKELTTRLKAAAGDNLTAIVLYGSAAGDETVAEHSDMNVLCLVARLEGSVLAKLQPASRWWWRKGHPAPMVFTLEELRDSADIFAIELLDMKQGHRMLWGEDFVAQLDVPMGLHCLQVERELRINVIRLRQAYLRSQRRSAELAELMIASSSSFAALFRHSLLSLGAIPAKSRRAAADGLGALIGLDMAPFHAALDLRAGKRQLGSTDGDAIFAAYLDVVTRVAQEMDRRLAAGVQQKN